MQVATSQLPPHLAENRGGAAGELLPAQSLTYRATLSEGGLRHILAKSVQRKSGFHYALIFFCQVLSPLLVVEERLELLPLLPQRSRTLET